MSPPVIVLLPIGVIWLIIGIQLYLMSTIPLTETEQVISSILMLVLVLLQIPILWIFLK